MKKLLFFALVAVAFFSASRTRAEEKKPSATPNDSTTKGTMSNDSMKQDSMSNDGMNHKARSKAPRRNGMNTESSSKTMDSTNKETMKR